MLRRAALLATFALLATAAPAQAYQFAGKRWPGSVVPYAVDAPNYEAAVDDAARAWNRSRIGIRFKKVALSHARLVVRSGYSSGAALSGCAGENGQAMVGWPGPLYGYSTIGLTGHCNRWQNRRLVAMHELGHALGLDHDNRHCALMNSSIRVRVALPRRCRGRRAAARLRRGPLSDDVRGARLLYSRPAPTESPSVAGFMPNATRPAPARPVTFSAGIRNPRLVYRWNFDDPGSGTANAASGLDAQHAFASPGVYDVTLQVFDGDAPIATRSRELVVTAEP